jgi:hypothetical protein
MMLILALAGAVYSAAANINTPEPAGAVVSIDAVGVNSSTLATAVRVGARQITAKSNATVRVDDPAAETHLVLSIDSSHGPEGFTITDLPAGKMGAAIVGGDARGVYYGLGRLLRNSTFGVGFVPGTWRGIDAPRLRNSFRAAYFAVHYDNFYAAAPVDDLATYLEDIALWGVNTLVVLLPGPSSYANGERTTVPDAPQIPALKNKTRVLLKLARDIGMSPAVIIVPNQGFDNGTNGHLQGHSPIPYTPFPDPLHVRGNLGALTCPFKGHEYLVNIIRTELEWYQDIGLDWLVFWPYDEGGCGCHDDWPCKPRHHATHHMIVITLVGCPGRLGMIL